VARSAKEFGSKSYGVTLAQEQVNFGTDRINAYGVSDRAKVEVCDYRNVTGQFDKIVSLEMCEHVGVKNIVSYYKKVHDLLKDDGLFVLQWTGIRALYNPQNPLTAMTLRPEAANCVASSSPMPRLAPVIRTVFPAIDCIRVSLSVLVRRTTLPSADLDGMVRVGHEAIRQNCLCTSRGSCPSRGTRRAAPCLAARRRA